MPNAGHTADGHNQHLQYYQQPQDRNTIYLPPVAGPLTLLTTSTAFTDDSSYLEELSVGQREGISPDRGLHQPQRRRNGTGSYKCNHPPCESSPMVYGTRSQLDKHQRRHRPYHERKFVCDCEKRFLYKKDLDRHRRTRSHLPVEQYPYQCDDCERRFQRNDHMERHKKTHYQPASIDSQEYHDQVDHDTQSLSLQSPEVVMWQTSPSMPTVNDEDPNVIAVQDRVSARDVTMSTPPPSSNELPNDLEDIPVAQAMLPHDPYWLDTFLDDPIPQYMFDRTLPTVELVETEHPPRNAPLPLLTPPLSSANKFASSRPCTSISLDDCLDFETSPDEASSPSPNSRARISRKRGRK